jgi:hypothetical protein
VAKSKSEEWADSVIDHITLALAHPRRRIKELEAKNQSLEQRCQRVEERVLELEAREAVGRER